MAFWKSAGYNGNYHVADDDQCNCPSCQYERKILQDAIQMSSGIPVVEQPGSLHSRTFYHGRGRQIGYIDAHLPSYDIIYAGYRPKVVKTFAVSTAGRLPPKDKHICIYDDKKVVQDKIERRIGEILSRLNYLASKNGMDLYEFKVSIHKDLEDELELDKEIKEFEDAQKQAVQAAIEQYSEDYLNFQARNPEQPMTPMRPPTTATGPRILSAFIPDADRYEQSDEESSVIFDLEDVDESVCDDYESHVRGGGDTWEGTHGQLYGHPQFQRPPSAQLHDQIYERLNIPNQGQVLAPFDDPMYGQLNDQLNDQLHGPLYKPQNELRPSSRREFLQDRRPEEWLSDADESDMELLGPKILTPPEAFAQDEMTELFAPRCVSRRGSARTAARLLQTPIIQDDESDSMAEEVDPWYNSRQVNVQTPTRSKTPSVPAIVDNESLTFAEESVPRCNSRTAQFGKPARPQTALVLAAPDVLSNLMAEEIGPRCNSRRGYVQPSPRSQMTLAQTIAEEFGSSTAEKLVPRCHSRRGYDQTSARPQTPSVPAIPDDDSDSMSSEEISAPINPCQAYDKKPARPQTPFIQHIPEFKRPKTALRFFDARPGTAETSAFLANPPQLGELDDGNLKEMNEYYNRALHVAQQYEEFKSVQDISKKKAFNS